MSKLKQYKLNAYELNNYMHTYIYIYISYFFYISTRYNSYTFKIILRFEPSL